jgi:uncharacterized SAM-binding protein YcdF (DUF218 family)
MGKIIVPIGVILFSTISYGAVSDLFLGPLESKYLPVKDMSAFRNIKWVVVLGGGHCVDPRLSITDQLSDTSLVRLVEGIRLHRILSNSKLILSGGSVFDSTSEASTMAKIAVVLGMDQKELVFESESKDTKNQERFIKNIIGSNRFILVTPASHMARSVSLFKAIGMKPIPVPTGYYVKKPQRITPSTFFPSSKGIDKMEQVVYEYLITAWARLRG